MSADLQPRENFVVKIGGSVLFSSEAYTHQAQRIADFAAQDDVGRVYVVVSARKGHTDVLRNSLCENDKEIEALQTLLQGGESPKYSERFNQHAVARHLLSGEIESAQHFHQELSAKGHYPDVLMQGANFPIIANGEYLRAEVDLAASEARAYILQGIESRIVVVPGFGAQNHEGKEVLLGRNASDLVAALIGRLDPKVHEVIYLKDVDGVYQGFGTDNQSLIPKIRADALRAMGCGKVLDERCLDYMNGNRIRVQHCEAPIGQGGTVIYNN